MHCYLTLSQSLDHIHDAMLALQYGTKEYKIIPISRRPLDGVHVTIRIAIIVKADLMDGMALLWKMQSFSADSTTENIRFQNTTIVSNGKSSIEELFVIDIDVKEE